MDEVYNDPVHGELKLQRSLRSATGYTFICIKSRGGITPRHTDQLPSP